MIRTLFLIIIIIFASFYSTTVFAQNASPAAEETISYDLPYPGMLPDNPLYFLKTLRDKFISMIISDPVKKAEFDILTSDKRFVAAVALINKRKTDLGITTLSKSNNYFYDAIVSTQNAIKQKRILGSLPGNLLLSSQKHDELIQPLAGTISKDKQARFQYELKRLGDFEKSVKELPPAK